MDHLLTMQQLSHDQCQPAWKRVRGSTPEQVLFHQACLVLQNRTNRLAVTILDGHRDQIGGPIGLRSPLFDHGLHSNLDSAALERLYEIVQVIDLPFRENDEHLLSPFHDVDRVAFCDFVLAASLNREEPSR